mmetsp:Transcript_3907/g.5907  ORF Transcript_3907/g.5907 Transcript_3907/m.5907 type:complete len:257 (-) Transcript_3907:89-859(-)
MQSFNGSIGILHSIKLMRNIIINRQISLHKSIDQKGNIPPTLEPPKRRSLPNSSGHKLEWTGGDLMARCCNANDARSTPTPMSTFERCTHDIGVARAVETIVDTPLGHFSRNMGLDWFVQFGGIYSVGGTHFDGGVELFGVNVHRNDFRCSCHFGTLDDGQSNSTEPKHSHSCVHLNLTSIPNRSKSSADTTSKKADLLQRSILLDLGTTNLRKDRIFAHGAASHEMVDGLSLCVLESGGFIRHDTLSLRGSDCGT